MFFYNEKYAELEQENKDLPQNYETKDVNTIYINIQLRVFVYSFKYFY